MVCGDDSGERVSLYEWSKGLRSGRNAFERVGSNPTADIPFYRRSLTIKQGNPTPRDITPYLSALSSRTICADCQRATEYVGDSRLQHVVKTMIKLLRLGERCESEECVCLRLCFCVCDCARDTALCVRAGYLRCFESMTAVVCENRL